MPGLPVREREILLFSERAGSRAGITESEGGGPYGRREFFAGLGSGFRPYTEASRAMVARIGSITARFKRAVERPLLLRMYNSPLSSSLGVATR